MQHRLARLRLRDSQPIEDRLLPDPRPMIGELRHQIHKLRHIAIVGHSQLAAADSSRAGPG